MLARFFTSPRLLLLMALLFLLGAAAWLTSVGDEAAPPVSATVVDRLHSRAVASMDSPVFAFERGWQVSAVAPIRPSRTNRGHSHLGAWPSNTAAVSSPCNWH